MHQKLRVSLGLHAARPLNSPASRLQHEIHPALAPLLGGLVNQPAHFRLDAEGQAFSLGRTAKATPVTCLSGTEFCLVVALRNIVAIESMGQ
jgi:hypothetical protein